MEYIIIADPLYRIVKFPENFKKIIDHPNLQRLRWIKQLGSASFVYPSANHTRFEHSLGVGYLAGIIAENLELEKEKYVLAGLLHDIGHGPFSHATESILYRISGIKHEDITVERIKEMKDVISELGYDYREIIDEIKGKTGIISGTLDADRLDYLERDTYFTGNFVGLQNVYYIINNFELYNGKIALKEKAVPLAESILTSRLIMYKTVYYHKTTIAVTLLLERAVESLLKWYSPEEIYKMDDYSFLSSLEHYDEILYDKISNRDLPKLIFSKNIKEVDKGLFEDLKSYNEVYVWYKPIKHPTSYKINVILKSGEVKSLYQVSAIVRSLWRSEKLMDNLRIYIDREMLKDKKIIEEIHRILLNYLS